jgi:hypothetical protein
MLVRKPAFDVVYGNSLQAQNLLALIIYALMRTIFLGENELRDPLEEKLLQVYRNKYPHNPEGVLEFHISQKMKEGKSREAALAELRLEEEEKYREWKLGIDDQIRQHEKTIERLTLQLSKGEISEVSYAKAVKVLEKSISELDKERKTVSSNSSKRNEILTPTLTSQTEPSVPQEKAKPTAMWFLVPLFFGIFGGIVAYVAVKDDDKQMAESLLGLGIVVTVTVVFACIIIIYNASVLR